MSRAFICGCLGTAFTDEERAFIADADPWGLILFKRNVESREQLRALTDAFRQLVGDALAPVLIDQEGGRVQRMGRPHWRPYPAAQRFGAECEPSDGVRAARLSARLMAHDLEEVGVNVCCAPVLDVADDLTHAVIGTRAFSKDPGQVAELGRSVMEGLMEGGVVPVVKHIPGHGRARADSHFELPIVDASREELFARDLAPFRLARNAPMAMTAHVVYTALDPKRPGTTSPIVIEEIIRGAIGFTGLLLSDDLSMRALGGPLGTRARDAFAAGVDIALHCNGDMAEGREVAQAAPEMTGATRRRADQAMAAARKGAEAFDVAAATSAMAKYFPDWAAN